MRRMRGAAAVVLGGLLAALLTGCGNPGGVDGQIADDWALASAPELFVPTAGVCHPGAHDPSGPLVGYQPVDCAAEHLGETAFVGTFTGDPAVATAPPTADSPARRSAYAACDKEAAGYLGADFRQGRLWMGVVVPSAAGWAGGARWFRCDLYQVPTVEDHDDPVARTSSLQGALADPASPLALGCYQVKATASGAIGAMSPIACDKAHNSEFAGVYAAAPAVRFPRSDADWQRLHNGCRAVVADYVKVPNDGELQFRTGTVAVPATEVDWAAGDRGVRCYLYLKDAKFTRSLEGAGAKALPAQ